MKALADIPGSLTPRQVRAQFYTTDTYRQFGAFEHCGRVIAARRVDSERGWLYYDDSEEVRVYTSFVPFSDVPEVQ